MILANFIYMSSTKQKIDQQNVEIAQTITLNLESMHSNHSSLEPFLESIGNLGYQIYVINESGEDAYFGKPFTKTELPKEAKTVVFEKKIYHGMSHFSNKFLMMGHFSNDVKNTVGVPFTMSEEQYGLFLRPNNKLLFSDIHMILAWFFVAVTVVSISGVILFAKHLIKPITRLTEATREITRENFLYPLKIDRNDELGQLAESFNNMQRQLQHNDEARKSFINNVSHDFQSPLMNIRGYAELLMSQNVSDQKAYPMMRSEVQLDEQIKQTIRRYQWRLQEKEIEVSYKLSPIRMKVDVELISNVWDNLITNAIKYNAHGGNIWMSLSKSEASITIIVKDSGIGMSKKDMTQIFDRFYRVDSSRKSGGTGLGLSIVKQVIDLHGGEIKVDSEVGVGTTFTIILPNKERKLEE